MDQQHVVTKAAGRRKAGFRQTSGLFFPFLVGESYDVTSDWIPTTTSLACVNDGKYIEVQLLEAYIWGKYDVDLSRVRLWVTYMDMTVLVFSSTILVPFIYMTTSRQWKGLHLYGTRQGSEYANS